MANTTRDNYTNAITWETSSVRTWLNDTFFNEAFNAEQQAMIPYVTVNGNDHSNDTTDRVFLLSVDEANQYFDSNEARSCRQKWWLRTLQTASSARGHYSFHEAYMVDEHGIIYGNRSIFLGVGIRPAMWIDLSSL